ncbi:MAG: zf-HC2 domain-containing protein [Kiritimatiellia bacterium]
MKCDKAKNWILLMQSGELGGRETGLLRDHLAGCASCRQFQGDSAKLCAVKATASPTPDYILHAIRHAAVQKQSLEKEERGILIFWRPMAAAAAAVLLAVLSWSVISGRGGAPVQLAEHWENGIDEKLESLEMQITSASYELEESGEWYEEDADELAAQLLAMEEST